MQTLKKIFVLIIFSLILVSCVSTSMPITSTIQPTEIQPTEIQPTEIQPTEVRATPVLIRPRPSPTPLAGASGYLLGAGLLSFSLDENRNPALDDIKEINLKTKENKILLSASDLVGKLPNDVLNPNTYSYIVSPDAKKTLINVCAAFDKQNACVTESFIVDFKTKNIKEIADVRKVAWEWAPDGSKLAGIQLDEYGFAIGTYIINNDGSNLIKLNEGSFQFFWSADSQTIYLIKITQDSKTIFESIKSDGTDNQIIKIEGLGGGNFLEAMDFSSDGKKVVYEINDSFLDPKSYKIYIANSDFTNSKLVYESTDVSKDTIDNLDLSPDNHYVIHNIFDAAPSIIDITDGSLVKLPLYDNLYVCGWAPDSSLAYVTSPTPEEFGFQSQLWLLPLSNPVIDVPYGELVECPLHWISDNRIITTSPTDLVAQDISNQHTEACYPHLGTDYEDTPNLDIPGQLDILNISSSLDDNNLLTVTIKFREVPDQIITNYEIVNKSETGTYHYNIGVDIDNNSKTGPERSGMDGEDAALMVEIFQTGDTVYGQVYISRAYVDRILPSDSKIVVDKDASTITFSGKIPGVKLTTGAVLNIVSFSVEGNYDYIGDTLCE